MSLFTGMPDLSGVLRKSLPFLIAGCLFFPAFAWGDDPGPDAAPKSVTPASADPGSPEPGPDPVSPRDEQLQKLNEQLGALKQQMDEARRKAIEESPELGEVWKALQEKRSLLARKQSEIPQIAEVEADRAQAVAEYESVQKQIRALQEHRKQHALPGADGSAPQPREGCAYCAENFDRFVAGDSAVAAGYDKRLADWGGRLAELRVPMS